MAQGVFLAVQVLSDGELAVEATYASSLESCQAVFSFGQPTQILLSERGTEELHLWNPTSCVILVLLLLVLHLEAHHGC